MNDFAGSALFTSFPGNQPFSEWQDQLGNYEKWWAHYSGESLLIQGDDSVGDKVLLFPLRNNLYKRFGQLHATLLFGAQPGNDLVRFYVESLNPETNEEESKQFKAAAFLNAVLLENAFYPELRRGARFFQAFGGTFIKMMPDPDYYLNVRMELLAPNLVFPVWGARDTISELYVMYWLSNAQAREYGYTGQEEEVLYTERWTKDSWEVYVGTEGQIATYGGKTLKGENPCVDEKTNTKMIPFVYIPRMATGSQYGESQVQDIIGLIQEVNTRSADMGDAIGESSHRKTWVKNYRGNGSLNLDDYDRGEVIDLGDTPPGMEESEMGVLDPPKYPDTTLEFLDWLESEVRQNTHTASVILGLDEGSQRSGETMAARALPTVGTVNDYRETWAEAFHLMALIALIYQSDNANVGKGSSGPLKGWKLRTDWHPVLPRDKQQLVTDEIALYTAGLRSLRQSLHQLGDVRDIEVEANDIEQEAEKKAELESLAQPMMMGDRSSNNGQTPSTRSKPSGNTSSGNSTKGKATSGGSSQRKKGRV